MTMLLLIVAGYVAGWALSRRSPLHGLPAGLQGEVLRVCWERGARITGRHDDGKRTWGFDHGKEGS